MSDIYQAPASELTRAQDTTDIEAALARASAGDFEFRPIEIIGESWGLLSGAKLPIVIGIIAIYGLSFVIQVGAAFLFTADPANIGMTLAGTFGSMILQIAVTTPIAGGLMYMALRRASGGDVSIRDLGSQFHRTGALILTGLLSTLLTYVGMLLLIIPGIYLMVAYLQAIPLVVDKGLSPWQALEASRKALSRCWFRMLGLLLMIGATSIVAIIIVLVVASTMQSMMLTSVTAAVVGAFMLVWILPLTLMTFGVAHRHIFGIHSSAEDAGTSV